MSFEFNANDFVRLTYKAGATVTAKVPRGNLYSGMNFLQKLEVDIVTAVASNVPDYQVGRVMQKVEILRDQDTIWSISGEMLQMKFENRNGTASKGNTTIAGAVATNVKGQLSLHLPFSPDDAMKPWDFAMDTRKHEYTIAITWRDMKVAGTLFGTIGGTIAVVDDENYIDIELERLALRPGDSLANTSPFMRGLRQTTTDVVSANSGFEIDVAKFKTYRNIDLVTTHEAATDQEVLVSTVFDGKIHLRDTQDHTYHNRRAEVIHEQTSQNLGLGSGLKDGIYGMPLTAFGSALDAIASDNTHELLLTASVVKLANDTTIHAIFDTIEQQ